MKAHSLGILFLLFVSSSIGGDLPGNVTFLEDPQHGVNSFAIKVDGKVLAVNRAPEGVTPDVLLLTHARREVVEAARKANSETVIAPAGAKPFLEEAEVHWQAWWDERFDYYKQQVTRIPVKDFPPTRYVEDGEEWEWQGLKIRFLATPGYTRDGGTFLIDDGANQVYALSGDLLLEGGRVPDLYSFQNEIPEAKVGGYHGYMGRIADWLGSLEKLNEASPGVLIPARGPLVTDVPATIDTASSRARAIYLNYLETNALHWYFGEERMGICAERVLGKDHGLKGMEFAEHVDLPDWCQHIGTTKLLISEDGNSFALDVGGEKQLEGIRQALADGLVKSVQGIFCTHLHNDHTKMIGEAAREFGCPVYTVPECSDALEHPGHWFTPGISPNAVDQVKVMKDGEVLGWKEYTFTFRFFPGQMYNHGALLVEKPGHDPVFFIGDSFSPSGIDDYCLMNRNLMRDDTGYALCFRKVEALPKNAWIVNQHIPHLFRFDDEELGFLKRKYSERAEMISEFTPWDDVNYAIDERWARTFPYGQEASLGEEATVEVVLQNHSKTARKFTLQPHTSLASELKPQSLEIAARGEGTATWKFVIPKKAPEKVHIVLFDISRDDGLFLPEWAEALVKVVPAP